MSVALEQPIVWKNGYPTADGRPFAEGDVHRKVMLLLIKALEDWYEEDKKVYVSGNLLIYYEEGSKRKRVAPDVFVVKGVRKRTRPNYLLWEEGRAPNIAIEVTSAAMRKEDTIKKFALYQDVLKIPEYCLFDPFGDYLKPQLQGYRLVDGKYKQIRIRNGQVSSRQLGLILRTEGKFLRLVDPMTGKLIPTCEEAIRKSQQARLRIQADTARIRAETARIRADIAALRKERLGRNVTLSN